MTTLRITAELMNGLAYVPGEYISLDGPLLYAVTLERIGHAMFGDPPSKDQLARETAEPDPAMPLDVHRAGDTWCYACSSAETGPHYGTTMTHWNKRIDDGLLVPMVQDGTVDMGRKGKVQINSAQYKSYHMPIWTEHVLELVWYARSAEPQRLARLLGEHVHHIGRHRNTGHGRIIRWEIAEADDAPADRWMWRPDGTLARPVPLAMLGDDYDGPVGHAPYRPPHWLIQHQTMCGVPGMDRGGAEQP